MKIKPQLMATICSLFSICMFALYCQVMEAVLACIVAFAALTKQLAED